MSTLFKHKAAKVRCSGPEHDINTIGMSRQQTNISALDTEALSIEPGKVFKKKTRVTCTEIWAGWFQLLHDLRKSKMGLLQKESVMMVPQQGSTVTDCKGQSSLGQRHPAPDSPASTSNHWSSDSWWGKAINSSTGNHQQHDVPNIATGQWHQLNVTSETKAGHFLVNHTAFS